MKQLSNKVNIVPVIAKSDCLTMTEIKKLKSRIIEELQSAGIRIYQLPDVDSDEDEEYKHQVANLRQSIPFAVCGANAMVEVAGKKVRGRQYPWGVVEVENPEHCDFVKLRSMLITHMQVDIFMSLICNQRLRIVTIQVQVRVSPSQESKSS